jgi:hypothetical protein
MFGPQVTFRFAHLEVAALCRGIFPHTSQTGVRELAMVPA